MVKNSKNKKEEVKMGHKKAKEKSKWVKGKLKKKGIEKYNKIWKGGKWKTKFE